MLKMAQDSNAARREARTTFERLLKSLCLRRQQQRRSWEKQSDDSTCEIETMPLAKVYQLCLL